MDAKNEIRIEKYYLVKVREVEQCLVWCLKKLNLNIMPPLPFHPLYSYTQTSASVQYDLIRIEDTTTNTSSPHPPGIKSSFASGLFFLIFFYNFSFLLYCLYRRRLKLHIEKAKDYGLLSLDCPPHYYQEHLYKQWEHFILLKINSEAFFVDIWKNISEIKWPKK